MVAVMSERQSNPTAAPSSVDATAKLGVGSNMDCSSGQAQSSPQSLLPLGLAVLVASSAMAAKLCHQAGLKWLFLSSSEYISSHTMQ